MMDQQTVPKAKILIVEDEGIIALELTSLLKQFGYIVLDNLLSGEKALERIEKDPPDLVLMDIVLKGPMDGIEAAHIIRTRWGIPVIFLTAYAEKERLKRAKLVYPFGFIVKPYKENDIRITVEMALYVSKVDRERRKAEEALKQSEARFKELTELLPETVFELNRDGKLTYCNKQFFALFGYSQEDLEKGLYALQVVIPEERERAKETLQKELNGEPINGGQEFTLLKKDGGLIPGSIH
jgi:PAS domain S-box-containing protein